MPLVCRVACLNNRRVARQSRIIYVSPVVGHAKTNLRFKKNSEELFEKFWRSLMRTSNEW